MKRIYICSPYRADTETELQENKNAARRLCRKAALEGNAVICPHLLYPQFLDEAVEDERNRGIAAGLHMLEKADEVWMLAGRITQGMGQEIARATEFGIPVKCMCDPAASEEHLLNTVLFGMKERIGEDGWISKA